MKRTATLLVVSGISALLTIGYLIYVGRLVGPSAYAEFSAALSFVFFFAIVFSSLTPAIARVVARLAAQGDEASIPALRRGVLRPLAGALAVAGILLVLPMVGVSRFLNFGSSAPLLLALATALIFAMVSAERGFLQGWFRFEAYNASLFVEAFVRVAVGIAVLQLVSRSAAGALVGYVAGVVIAEVVNAAVLREPASQAPSVAVDWLELRRLVVPMMMLMVAAAASQNLDMIAVKRWFSPAFAGQYGAASAVSKMFGVIFTPLYVLTGPVLTRHHVHGEGIVAPALRFAGIFASLSTVGLLVLFYRGQEVVGLLFGAAYVPGAWIAAHLGAVSILLHISLLLAQVFITVHDFRFLKLFAASAVVQLLGLVVFHASIGEVLVTLYVAQLVLILPLSAMLMRHSRREVARAST